MARPVPRTRGARPHRVVATVAAGAGGVLLLAGLASCGETDDVPLALTGPTVAESSAPSASAAPPPMSLDPSPAGSPSASPVASPSPSPSPSLTPEPEPEPVDAVVPVSGADDAMLALAAIVVSDERLPGYDRDLFGQRWADVDRNGCDQRNDVLARDLTDVVFKEGTRDCVVLTGTFADPYTGTTMTFQRGNDTSTLVQIDHVVALADAWATGAARWSPATRELFANDPLVLLASDGAENASKGARNADEWLPSNPAFWCDYVARQVAIKVKYSLVMTPGEASTIRDVLTACGPTPLPTDDTIADPDTTAVVAEAPAAEPDPAAPAPLVAVPAPESPADVHYANCSEVRAAGAAPIHAGEPGYSSKLDRDGDGVACEG